jgi:hypothetical protein
MKEAKKKTKYVFLVIEANLSEIFTGIPQSKLSPEHITRRLIRISELGVQILFVGNSKNNLIFIEQLLREIE